jgi:hypothetical protein
LANIYALRAGLAFVVAGGRWKVGSEVVQAGTEVIASRMDPFIQDALGWKDKVFPQQLIVITESDVGGTMNDVQFRSDRQTSGGENVPCYTQSS